MRKADKEPLKPRDTCPRCGDPITRELVDNDTRVLYECAACWWTDVPTVDQDLLYRNTKVWRG